MDDRILLIPPIFAPDWENAAAAETLLNELHAFLPVDILSQPTLKEGPYRFAGIEEYIETVRTEIKPQHHVLEVGGTPGEPILMAVAKSPARSVTICGFYPSPRTLASRGEHALAAAAETVYKLTTQSPAQTLTVIMAGADPLLVEQAIRAIDATTDADALRAFGEQALTFRFTPELQVQGPALYLAMHHAVPGAEDMFDLFCEYAPKAEGGELAEWGPRGHDPAGGYELAGKAIAFIKQVIAQREAAGQT